MRRLLLMIAGCMALASGAQDLAEGHRLIDESYKAERYGEVIARIDRQLDHARGTTWEDSLYHYVYPYGRALRAEKGEEASAQGGERLVEMVRRRNNTAHLLHALFDLSWIYYDLGRLHDCVRTDSMAVAIAEGDPGIPPSTRGKARQYLAFDYHLLGDYSALARHAQAALDEYAKADNVPSIQWAESYNGLGVALREMGRFREGEKYYRKALEVLGNDSTVSVVMRRASITGNLGIMWDDAGDPVRSKGYYYEALRNMDWVIAHAEDPSTRDQAILNRSRSYVNLASSIYMQGDLARARALLQMAWNDRSKILGEDAPQLLNLYEVRAELEMEAGELDKAEELLQTLLEATGKGPGRNTETFVNACIKASHLARLRNEYQRADSIHGVVLQALDQADELLTDPLLRRLYRQRAQLNIDREHFPQARADLLQARAAAERIGGTDHYRVVELDMRLAQVAYEMGEYGRVLQYADAALASLQDRVWELKRSTMPRPVFMPEMVTEAFYWKVRAEQALQPANTGSGKWNQELDLAMDALRWSYTEIEDHTSKLNIAGAQASIFRLALDDAYDTYRKTPSADALERFLVVSEASRSVLLKSRLNGFIGLNFAGVPDSVLAREQELHQALSIDPDNPEAHLNMDKHEKAYGQWLRELEQRYPKYFELKYGNRPITLAEVRERMLAPGRSLIIYARTGEALYALVVNKDGEALKKLPADDLHGMVQRLEEAMANRRTEAYVKEAHALYQTVIQPLEPLIGGQELLIVPDGELHGVAFEALIDQPAVSGFADHLLLQRFAVAYLHSATTALQFAALARGTGSGLFASAPGFTDGLKQRYAGSVSDTALVDRHFLHYVRQPFAMNTARHLGRSYGAEVLLEDQATETAFRREAPEHAILFLGTHAEMDPERPMYSRLVFSKEDDGLDPDSDGYLHMYELYELDLRAQLAVLTACESGKGKRVAGEGIRSLGAAFAYAGCPSLVVALWSVDEKTSAAIIEGFHEYLAQGLPKHEALRQAKLAYLKEAQDELAHPYYWAGLVLIGNTDPVELGRPATGRWPWLLLVPGAAAFAVWRRRTVRSRNGDTAHRAA